jgi:ComEC/Rec2-related protein
MSFNEQGSRDWRMLPAAIAVWTSCLLTHWIFNAMVSAESPKTAELSTARVVLPLGVAWVMAAIVASVGIALTIALIVQRATVMLLRLQTQSQPRHDPPFACLPSSRPFRGKVRHATGMLLAGVALLAAAATWGSATSSWHDPAMVQAREGPAQRVARMRVNTPARTADLRQADCQIDATLSMMGDSTVMQHSTHTVRVFASGADCGRLKNGATVQVSGRLERSRFGNIDIWLICRNDGSVTTVRAPNPVQTAISIMQERFFAVTEGLSDQGRVLVPGLTIGMLGQEHAASAGRAAVDTTYAALLEDRFARSGIMHLMAVSGGHFMLIGALARRFAAYLQAPRWVAAVLMAGMFVLLAMLVYPSDSVMRALVMGLLGSAALLVGRRPQALNALCWTTVLVLIVNPAMARSYGFALSCAAVLGIALFSTSMAEWLEAILPKSAAKAMAMTVSAQLLTLPIQVMMEPQVPLLSVPANLIVSPLVGFATMLGLVALVTAVCSTGLSFVFAWSASTLTAFMQWCALWLGGSSWATMPWAEGWKGALLAVACEALAAVAVLLLRQRQRHKSMEHTGIGSEYSRRWLDPIGLWIRQLPTVFETTEGDRLRGS